MRVEKILDGVFKVDGRLATENMVKGSKAYSEELVEYENTEFRMWNPYRSKLSAAIMNGLKHMEIKRDSKVLYLGAATGTTSSHVSDIVSESGKVYCVELSDRNMRQLIKVCEKRRNMLPILADAREPANYSKYVKECDIIYQDVSSREQAEILISNSKFLKSGGYAYFIIKSQSIDVGRDPKEVFEDALKKTSGIFEMVESVKIEPYDELHLFAVLKKR